MKQRCGKGSQAQHVILQKACTNHKTTFISLFFKDCSFLKVNFPCRAGGPHIPQGGGKLSEEDKKMAANSSTEFKLLVMIFRMFSPWSKNMDAVRSLTFNSFSFLHL